MPKYSRTEIRNIGYLDLVGIKEIAQYDPSVYIESMEEFKNLLFTTLYNKYHNNDSGKQKKLYLLSDSVFFDYEDISELIDFISDFRKKLLFRTEKEGDTPIFFIGGITKGTLNIYNIDDSLSLEKAKSKDSKTFLEFARKYAQGLYFQESEVSDVYLKRLELKGIGMNVDHDIVPSNIKRNKLVQSFFLPSDTPSYCAPFYDLRFSKDILESYNTLDKIFVRYFNANIIDDKLGKYYIPVLATWIASEDFSNYEKREIPILDFLFGEMPEAWDNLGKIVPNLEKKSKYFYLLYLFLLDKLYDSYMDINDIQLTSLFNKIFDRKKFLNTKVQNIKTIPNEIIKPRNKKKFAHNYFHYCQRQ